MPDTILLPGLSYFNLKDRYHYLLCFIATGTGEEKTLYNLPKIQN